MLGRGAALSAEGTRLEAPEAPRGWGLGRGSRLGGLGKRRERPSGVRAGAPAANDFGTLWAYKTTLVALKYQIQVVNFCVFT